MMSTMTMMMVMMVERTMTAFVTFFVVLLVMIPHHWRYHMFLPFFNIAIDTSTIIATITDSQSATITC